MGNSEKTFEDLSRAVYQGNLAEVQRLAAKVDADLQPYNAYGNSILMAAIDRGHSLELIKTLVEVGKAKYDYKNNEGETPISFAQFHERKDVVDYFNSLGANVQFVPFEELPQEEKDKRLAEAVADWTDDKLAARITRMAEGGARVKEVRIRDRPALHFLARQGLDKPDVYKALILGGADPTEQDADGKTALHWLANGGSAIKVARELLKIVSVELRDRNGQTLLHAAVQSNYWGHPKFVKFLVDEAGADLTAKDDAGKQPLDYAEGEAKTFLLSKQTPPLDDATRDLLAAIRSNDLAGVTAALAAGANPSATEIRDDERETALHAIFQRDVDRTIVEAVLAHPGLDLGVRNKGEQTPLHAMLQRLTGDARFDYLDKLLALGADINAVDRFQATPLFELISFYEFSREDELFDRMVAAGANIAHTDHRNYTIVDDMFATTQRFSEVNDKPGFVRLLQHLIAANVPSAQMSQVTRWLATVGAKYRPGATPAAPAPPSAARQRFTAITDGALARQIGKDAYLPIAGAQQAVALFDWYRLLDEEAADEHELVSQIREYHITGDAAAKVEAEEWIPFGIVGMTGSFDSYEEIAVDGTLYLDLTKATDTDAPVVFDTQSYLGLSPADPLEPGAMMYRALIAGLTKTESAPAATPAPAAEAPAAKQPAAKKAAAQKPKKAAKKPAKKAAAQKSKKPAKKPPAKKLKAKATTKAKAKAKAKTTTKAKTKPKARKPVAKAKRTKR